MKLDWLHWFLIAFLLFVGAATWLTPYRYEHWRQNHLVRIHRITGDAERLSTAGWLSMEKIERIEPHRYIVEEQ